MATTVSRSMAGPVEWAAAAFQTATEPWVVLLIRLLLAQAFLVQQVGMMLGGSAGPRLIAPLGAGWWSDLATYVSRSDAGAIVQALSPLLLAAGLLTRPAAAAMLVEALLLPLPPAAQAGRSFWVALLGWVLVSGPGPLSLDRPLGRGLRASAVPGAAAIATGYARIGRWLAPLALLALRVWLAAAPAVHLMPAMAPRWAILPHVPAVIAHLPVWLGLLCCALLAAGLGTRPVSLALLFLAPVGHLHSIADERVAWVLALAVLASSGGGALSLDRPLTAALRRMRTAATPVRDLPHVVVVGGGFGGIAAARGLSGGRCRVTLVDQRNFTLFQPLLYQVATAGLSPAEIATPIRELFRSAPNVRVLLGRVTGVDTRGRAVMLGTSRVGYDFLVLATGARHSYFGHDDWAPRAPGLKTVEDATAIRHRLLQAFEEAESCEDEAGRRAWLTFLVVGGGPTGVELAGAVAELARNGLAGEFRNIDPAQARVLLVQSAPRLLPSFPPRLSSDAARRLATLGVEVQLDRKLEALTETGATVGGQPTAARTVLWAAGVMASEAAAWLGAEADGAGRVVVGPDLSVPGSPEVFVLGDTAASRAWAGQPVPGLAPAAKQGGAYVARVIRARLAGRPAPGPFRYRHYGSLATIGRQAAVAEFGPLRLTGAPAWWLWGAAHIAFLVGGRNRMAVLVQWFWAYVTFRRGTRLITGTGVTE